MSQEAFESARRRWEAELARSGPRLPRFETISGTDVPALGLPAGDPDGAYLDGLGFPGQFPYTRGIHPSLYRGRLWTMRQFAGFGTAADTNARYRYLLEHGQTGLSVAFDMPTLMGYDSDHPRALGEVGKCGVAVASLEDMETLFEGIPVGEVSTSMTINAPAAIVWAMYIANAEKQGVPAASLRGTIQNDILKEYIAQKEWVFPPEAHMRLVVDTIEWAARHLPLWHPVSISGYHIREAGSTAAQELAYTLYDGFAYVEAALARGLGVDEFAPRLSFFFNAHSDFFEEVAKYRAARRIWARRMKGRYGARDPRSMQLRFHAQTAGCSLTAQQPENNVARVALQALSAVLGGAQSLHTNSMDETLALPTEKAVTIALRTQQVLACETGVANTIDPLGGSWFVERETDRLEAEAEAIFIELDRRGGMVRAIEDGYPQREIGRASYDYARKLQRGEQVMVGVNRYADSPAAGDGIPLLRIEPRVETSQRERLAALRRRRDAAAARRALDRVRDGARGHDNLMGPILEAVRAYATLGEVVDAMREVFGTYREPSVF
ncbi:MAG: methylmalonyl-CoA mutase [Planctomycetes bacterium]|nr:methylmalonyl-CoA mutase [Planctomycetota bacterium]